MRFILYVSLLLLVLPVVFMRPFFGLCVYYVVSLLQPKMLCWRPEFQDALLVGIPLVVGAIAIGVKRTYVSAEVNQATGEVKKITTRFIRNPLFEPSWQIALCVLLIVYLGVTRLLAPYPLAATNYQFKSLCKVLFVMTLLTGLVSDSRRFRILFLVVAFSSGFWAIKGGLKVIFLGPHQVYGRSYDNNLFALVSVMALPMIFYFGLSLKHVRWRTVFLVLSALMCVGIIGSRSRAGFLAFAVVLLCMAWNSRYRLRAVFAIMLVVSATLVMSGREIVDRVDSIIAYRQDRSSRSRFYTWNVASSLFKQNPLLGVGFNNFEQAKDRFFGGRKAAHNIYLQNAAELGALGHPIWLTLIFGSIFSLHRFMRQARWFPPDMRWPYYCSRALLLGILGFCVHGLFHNEEYLELMFCMIGLNIALQAVTNRELQARDVYERAGARSKSGMAAASRPCPSKPVAVHPGKMFEPPWRLANLARRGRKAFSPFVH
ncbi:MAG: O-antigen ligase family protein [Phycisphaerae bacterium]